MDYESEFAASAAAGVAKTAAGRVLFPERLRLPPSR
jgi:hypothetical protein